MADFAADPNANPGPDASCLGTWLEERRFSHSQFSLSQLAATVRVKGLSITVIIPAKEVASTVGRVVARTVRPLVEARIVSNVVVVDAASKDGSGQVAAAQGAQVLQRAAIAPELGPSRGKGDALWRGLLATDGDIVAFVDADTGDPAPLHLMGILGPLILHDDIHMVKACFSRPFKSASGDVQPHEGGRVTEILARPLLNSHWPDLAGFGQPLAGEFAARRSLLEQLSFPAGYGVEIGTLVDAYHLVGLHGLAQVDVGQRQNAHKPLRDLSTMAKAILCTAEKRRGCGDIGTSKIFLPWENGFHNVDTTERPPVCQYNGDRSPTVASPVERPPVYPCPPFVVVEGVRMFRDIGGYATRSGQTVRPKLIYRSGEPSNMTEAGRRSFDALEIVKIFDLRSPVEIESADDVHGKDETPRRHDSAVECNLLEAHAVAKDVYGNLLGDGRVKRIAVPVFSEEDWLPESREARLKSYASAEEGYARAYKFVLLRGTQAFRQICLHLSCSSPGSILLHCTAGKDRTGVITMLILLLAGCDAPTIAQEYALNGLDSDREWGRSATKRLLAQPGLNDNINAVANIVQAKEAYMLRTLEMFDAEFGGIEAYLQQYLGLDKAMIGTIRANLTI